MPRPLPRRLLAALWLLLAAMACGLGARATARPPDLVAAEAANPRLFSPTGYYGVNVDLIDLPPAEIDRNLAAIRAAGFTWVRQRLSWRRIEPSPGAAEWQGPDLFLDAAYRQGLKPLVVLVDAPAWAHRGDPTPTAPPDDPGTLAAFAARLLNRYPNRIGALQVWDEPNIAPNWGDRAIDPAGYGRLLHAVASVVRGPANHAAAGNVRLPTAGSPLPPVPIVAAGLAPNAEVGGLNLADLDFLAGLYDAGAAPDFDVVAAKPYGLWYAADDRTDDPDALNFTRVERLRAVMLQHGDGAKPIWAVEFGWNAPPPGWQGQPSPWGAVSEAEQAAETRRAVTLARARWPWLTLLGAEAWRPPVAPDDPRLGFALVRDDLSPRPVLTALMDLMAHPVLGPGAHRLSLAPEPGTDPDTEQRVTFRFTGTDLDLRWFPAEGVRLGVRIDGRAERVVDVGPCPTCGIGLSLPPPYPWAVPSLDNPDWFGPAQRVTLASGLASGEHEATLRVERPRSPAPVLDFLIRDAPALDHRSPLSPLLVVLAVLCLCASGALVGQATAALPWARWRLVWGGLADGRLAAWRLPMAVAALALVWYVSPAPVSWLALAAVVGLAARRPARLLPLIVASAPLWWHLKRLGWGWPAVERAEALLAVPALAPAEALTLALVAAVALNALLARAGRVAAPAWRLPRLHLPDAAPAAFVALGVIGVLVAEHQREAVREWRTVLVEPALFYYLGLGLLRRRRDALALPLTLVAVAGLLALWGLVQYGVTPLDIEAEGVKRLRSLYPSPVNMGLLLGRALPVATAVALLAPLQRPARLAWLALTTLLGLTLLLTFSLGAWIGTAAALLVVALFLGRRGAILAGMGLLGLAALVLALAQLPRIGNALSGGGTFRLRLLIWQASLTMLRDHPILGIGLDNFLYQYRDHPYMLPEAASEPNLSHPHNLILDFWLRLGLLGPPLLLATLIGFAHRTVAALRCPRPATWERAAVVGLTGAMVDTVVHGLTDNSFFLPDLALLFWVAVLFVRLPGDSRLEGAPALT